MPKILIISDAISRPSFSPRMRFLSSYLYEKGWDVTLCSERYSEIRFKHDYRLKLIDIYHFKRGTILREIEWAIVFVLNLLFSFREHIFLAKLKKCFKGESFDIICCSTFSTFPLRACRDYAKWIGAPLHIDLRDIAEQVPNSDYAMHRASKALSKLIINRYITQRNRILRKAESITSISPWHVDFLKKINTNTSLIYNGFNEKVFFFDGIKQPVFSLLYDGKLYLRDVQDPSSFFAAVQNLNKRKLIDSKWFHVDFFVDDKTEEQLIKTTGKYGIGHFMFYHSYVEPHLIPLRLQKCSIALIFACKVSENGANGIIPTKLYEAIGAEKPVLCTKNDESVMEKVILETKCGISTSDVKEIEDFLLERIEEWRTNGFTHQAVNMENKKYFSRQYQSEQFIEIFEKLMQQNKSSKA